MAGALPRHAILRDGLQLADLACLGLALIVAGSCALEATPALSKLVEASLSFVDAALAAFALTLGHAALAFFGVYATDGSLLARSRTIRASAVAAIWAALIGAAAFGFGFQWATPIGLTSLALVAAGGVGASRGLCSLAFRLRRRSRHASRNVHAIGIVPKPENLLKNC